MAEENEEAAYFRNTFAYMEVLAIVRRKLSESRIGFSDKERIKNDRESLREAAKEDPDCLPLTDDELEEMKPVNKEEK